MRVFDSTQLEQIRRGGAVSIGNFDGLHLGHQDILRACREICPAGPVTAMTFEPHPAAILHPEKAPGLLSPLPMKIKLLEQAGVDQLVVITDSLRLLNLSPKDFVDEFLMKTVGPKAVVEGPNFNFGYGRSGNVQVLRQLGQDWGFEVVEVPYREIHLDSDRRSVVCSSSLIRRLLEKGEVQEAASILGRRYRLIGKTIPGRGVGRELGFPTANIHPEKQIIPDEGVYAGFVVVGESLEEVCVGGHRRPSAFSLGRAKTFLSDYPLLIEAHILEPKVENLYGKYLAMEFVERVRGQQRFESKEALIDQIRLDCKKCMEILEKRATV
jgi:riboflavin kinase/FMN adenylyltransferase